MDTVLARRRLALIAFFFLPGLALASWVTRTPAIRDAVNASIAEMGLILLGLSFGSMAGVLASGGIVARLGARPATKYGLALIVLSMVVLATGVAAASQLIVALGLMFFGLGAGTAEIALNVDGADVERLMRRPFLHSLHGFFSLGTVCGALIGLALTALDCPVSWHLAGIAVICAAMLLAFLPWLATGIGKDDRDHTSHNHAGGASLWTDRRLLLIGLIVLALALAEGSANDWLPILMVDEYHFSQASGSLVFLAFASSMTLGRFCGGWFLRRFGRAKVIRGCTVLGAAGIALVIFSTNPVMGGSAVVLWGLGASLGFPVAISAAGDSGPNPAGRVRVVAVAGYIAFLVGPPLLGFIGEHHGLRMAMMVVLGLVAIAALAAPAVSERRNG